jgi:hypothetical protein
MTSKELAALLDGNEYREEISSELKEQAKKNNLVVVYGASDDLMEFDGAIYDEVGCYDGGVAYLTNDGLLEQECDEACPYYLKVKKESKTIEAVWCETNEYSWTYKTNIPHETFDVYEDGEKYCRGIVFSMEDLS